VPIGIHDHAAQQEWEQYQTQKGIARYRASLDRETKDGGLKRRSLVELEPGQRIAEELIGPLVASVKDAQATAIGRVTEEGRGRGASDHDWMLCSIPAETLGVVTVLKALTCEAPSSFTGVCRSLGGRVQDEYDLMRWKEREAQAAKEAKAAEQAPPLNLYRLMTHRNKTVDKRVFEKWSRKAPLFSAGDWPMALKASLGMTLLTLLVESNAWFEAYIQRENSRTKRMFRMTDLALAWVSDRHNSNELNRPYLLPMICEPRDHCYPD